MKEREKDMEVGKEEKSVKKMESALYLAFLFFTFFSEKRKSFRCLCRDVDVAVVAVDAAAAAVVVVAKNRFQLKVREEAAKVPLVT